MDRPALEVDQLAAVADGLGDHGPMVWLGAVLGLRWGKVAALPVDSFDFLHGSIAGKQGLDEVAAFFPSLLSSGGGPGRTCSVFGAISRRRAAGTPPPSDAYAKGVRNGARSGSSAPSVTHKGPTWTGTSSTARRMSMTMRRRSSSLATGNIDAGAIRLEKASTPRFLKELRERVARFGLGLHPDKTRLIEFGRFAARNRAARGLGKPETFDFLGFTYICAKYKNGRFMLKRITTKKRVRAELHEVRDQLQRRHLPVPEQGRWLASVVRGHLAYYALPGNIKAVRAFQTQATRHWFKALRRRSQRHRLNWAGMDRLAKRWLPPARIMHPWPSRRFYATT